jgi:hypothetical protein
MELRKEIAQESRQESRTEGNKIGENFIDDISEVNIFLKNNCYSVPDISINGQPKTPTNIKWLRRNIDVNLDSIENIRYIDNKTLEIKYLNGNNIKLFAD